MVQVQDEGLSQKVAIVLQLLGFTLTGVKPFTYSSNGAG